MTRRATKGVPKVAVLTMAIGIGASTAVITVAEALLIRPMPVASEGALVVLWGETRDGQLPNVPLTLGEVGELQRQSRVLSQVAYHSFRGASVNAFRFGDRVVQLDVSLVAGNWFDVLGSRAVAGRAFEPEDDTKGSAPTLVLSHRAWREHFAGDTSVVRRSITHAITGESYRIVGVMPPGLEYPRGTEAWTPMTAWSTAIGAFEIVSNELDVVARLSPGATHEQARSEMTTFFERLPSPGWRRDVSGVVHGFREVILGDVRPAMRIMLLAGAMLLLVACVNVGNLLLFRSIDSARELVVRAALGASRAQIVGHQLGEAALLAIAAGAAGSIVAVAAVKLFVAFAPPGLPRLDTIAINGAALAGAVGVTVLSLVVAGLAPAALALRVNASDALRSGTKHSMGRRTRLAGELMVATQVGLAVVALSAAALVTRSFIHLLRTDLKFDASRLVVVELAVPEDRLADKARYRDLLSRLDERLTNVPGIASATPVLSVPFIGGGGGIDGRIGLPGQGAEERRRNPMVNMEIITPTFFTTIATDVLQGRAFTEADREEAPRVVIVSASTAQALWPGQDPIGKRVDAGGERTVIGVAPDTRYRDLLASRPSVYFPLAQSQFPVAPTTLLVRTQTAASPVTMIRQAISEVDPGVIAGSVLTLEEYLEGSTAQPRLNAMILSAFAAVALALAAIGLFSVMSTMVLRRRREIGIRMALGATSRMVGTMVVARGVAVAACGTFAGIAAARATGSMLGGLLHGVDSSDTATTLGVALVVLLIATIACLVPAKVGSRVEPKAALSAE